MMLLNVAGCGNAGTAATQGSAADSQTASADGKVTLNVWHQWSNDTNELKKLYDNAVIAYMEEI